MPVRREPLPSAMSAKRSGTATFYRLRRRLSASAKAIFMKIPSGLGPSGILEIPTLSGESSCLMGLLPWREGRIGLVFHGLRFRERKVVMAMFRKLKEDLDAVMVRDPAARSRLEVFFLYSGFKAVRAHRRANWFYRHNMKFIARFISQHSRKKTGIEIHPAAKIGKGLFIDHGMGVVIGETTEIGNNCTLYQNVTLGGTGKDQGKRHPTLGDNVLVGAGAKVLGPFTVGDNARVAAGAVVLDTVPPDATAVGVPARVVKIGSKKVGNASEQLDQIHVADPVSMELCRLRGELERLQNQVNNLETREETREEKAKG